MMRAFAEDVLDALLERQVHEIIGAVVVGLALSLCLYGFHRLVRRKVSDDMALMVSLFLLANVASTSMAIGYLRYRAKREAIPASQSSQPQPFLGWTAQVAQLYVGMADENRDGVISREEASRMIDRADENSDGVVSPEEMSRMIDRKVQQVPAPGLYPADCQSGPGLQ
jgi:hypothetical protein